MAIRFELADGQLGTLDVSRHMMEAFGAQVTGAQNGLVYAKFPDGSTKAFSLGAWAQETGAKIIEMQGFNNPESALNTPPNGMNYLDQSVFYQDGMDMAALMDLFPQTQKLPDERIVVLDNDGLWKTMWSPYLVAPQGAQPPLESAAQNLINDPRLVIRQAGIVFFFALAGMDTPNTNKGVKIEGLVKALQTIGKNAPYENKFQIGKLLNQTTGLDPWKFYNALLAPEEVGGWLKSATKLSSFAFRMKQADMAELVVRGMRNQVQKEYALSMHQLYKLPETKALIINLKSLFSEFIQFLVGLDLLRDLSKTTGLQEWVSLTQDTAFDKSKLPPMPEFVGKFVTLLKWMMPITQQNSLAFAKGKKGLKSVVALGMMIDDCIYSLAGVPDSTAKYKMFMALKRLQAQIETKLSFIYHPSPEENKDGLKENPFMQIKQIWSSKREELYRLCQLPKESWNNSIIQAMRNIPNLEQFYDQLHPSFAQIMKSFVAMDAAYDMQPWVDVNHAERTHDPFSQYEESFGLPPPEAGYLAKNSPRAVQNIASALVEGAGVISSMSEEANKALLRNPYLMANLIKTLMVASVNRELGTVEVLSKFGINSTMDPNASPDSHRIWEDPEVVQQDIDKQVQELMGSMAMEAMMNQQQQQDEEAQATQMQEQARDQGEAPKAGAGPAGPPMRAQPMRR